MPFTAMCAGLRCPDRNSCYRYRACPGLQQIWTYFDQQRTAVECKGYLPLELARNSPLMREDWQESDC